MRLWLFQEKFRVSNSSSVKYGVEYRIFVNGNRCRCLNTVHVHMHAHFLPVLFSVTTRHPLDLHHNTCLCAKRGGIVNENAVNEVTTTSGWIIPRTLQLYSTTSAACHKHFRKQTKKKNPVGYICQKKHKRWQKTISLTPRYVFATFFSAANPPKRGKSWGWNSHRGAAGEQFILSINWL